MTTSALNKLENISKKINSRDPRDIADYLGIRIVDACGSLIAFVTIVKGLTFIAVNPRLGAKKYDFALSHELGHVVCKHLNAPGFLANGAHQETSLMDVPLYASTLCEQEKEANLIAADFMLDTPTVLDMVGYENKSVAQYRELRAKLREVQSDYESTLFSVHGRDISTSLRCRLIETRRLFQRTSNELKAIEQELQQMDCCLTIPEMAREMNVSSVVMEYKLEALRIRGYDIDPIELASYSQVFQ